MTETQTKFLVVIFLAFYVISYFFNIRSIFRLIKERRSNLYNWASYIEVIFNDEVIGSISYFSQEENDWIEFHITPYDDGFVYMFRNDLWEEHKFTFRDPDTKYICTSGYEVKAPPGIFKKRVQLKNIHFSNRN